MDLAVYFDYTCAYSYAAGVWLRQAVKGEPGVVIDWRPFIVREVNRSPSEGVPFWEQEGAGRTRTGLAFIAGEAAARQGPLAYDRFRSRLQAAFHVRHLDIRQPGALEGLASEAGLDVARFAADRADPGLLREAGRSHEEAVERYGVFGTPTLVFPNGRALYLKLAEPPAVGAASRVFALVRELAEEHRFVQEIKVTRQEHP